MRRREFIASGACAVVGWPLTARGQPARTYRIGILGNTDGAFWETLRHELGNRGYVEGRNLTMAWGWVEGRIDQYPALARELVDKGVDLIVAGTTPAALAAKRATATIPIVMTTSSFPDKLGLVDSLARPGGNVTGLCHVAPETNGKRLELLKEVAPAIARVAVFWNPGNALIEPIGFRETVAAAAALGLKVDSVEVRSPDDFSGVFASLSEKRLDALFAFGNPVNFKGLKLIVDFAAANRIPSIYEERQFVEAGGLMSYAPSYIDLFRRAATYVDRILKGEKPAEMPVELPTKFEFIISLKTAEALGLTISPTLLARADEVIE